MLMRTPLKTVLRHAHRSKIDGRPAVVFESVLYKQSDFAIPGISAIPGNFHLNVWRKAYHRQ